MGFDLYGQKPENKKGEYFRNNIWWWHPLWSFVCEGCSDILSEKDMKGGCFNEGYLITNEKVNKIVEKLEEVIQTKKFENFCQSVREYNLNLKDDNDFISFSKENVKGFIQFCKYSGGFEIC